MKLLLLRLALGAVLAPLAANAGQPSALAGPPPQPASTLHKDALALLQNGSPESLAEAHRLLSLAAARKFPPAIGALGYLHANGLGVARDDTAARRYFSEAADLGCAESQTNLALFMVHGRGGPVELEKGIAALEGLAAAGNNQAALALGEIYYAGFHSPRQEPDYAKARAVLAAPAEAGLPNAQNFLGVMLKDGRNGPGDPDAARLWFEKAAWQGNAKACTNLAEIWNPKSDNRQARIEALRWLMVAAELGEVLAKYHLEDIGDQVPDGEKHAASALAAVTLGVVRACR
jgi:TPR repeat protein